MDQSSNDPNCRSYLLDKKNVDSKSENVIPSYDSVPLTPLQSEAEEGLQQEEIRHHREDNNPRDIMNYDDILEELGESGPWHIINLLLLWLPSLASGIFVLTYSFSGKSFS